MEAFEEEKERLFQSLGEAQKMVLATSLQDKVTARMVNVIIRNHTSYFQTDLMSRKCGQL